MHLGLTEEQVLLQDTVRRLFEAECTPARLRKAEVSGFDASLWQKLTGLGIPAMRAAGRSPALRAGWIRAR